jgi:hypothetical protein
MHTNLSISLLSLRAGDRDDLNFTLNATVDTKKKERSIFAVLNSVEKNSFIESM